VTTGTRCPACGSMVRPGSSWCSLCHADLRSEEEKAAARPPEPWLDDTVEAPLWAPAPRSAVVDDGAPGPTYATAPEPAGWATETVTATTTETESATERRGRHARPAEAAPTSASSGSTIDHAAGPASAGSTAVAGPSADAVLTEAGVDVQAMMSLLAADQTTPLPSLSGRLAYKGNRAIAAVLAAVGLIVVGVVVMTVLGLLVH